MYQFKDIVPKKIKAALFKLFKLPFNDEPFDKFVGFISKGADILSPWLTKFGSSLQTIPFPMNPFKQAHFDPSKYPFILQYVHIPSILKDPDTQMHYWLVWSACSPSEHCTHFLEELS